MRFTKRWREMGIGGNPSMTDNNNATTTTVVDDELVLTTRRFFSNMAKLLRTIFPLYRSHSEYGVSIDMADNQKVTQVHVTTLDEVVSVNSFFTVAVFLGLSFTPAQNLQPTTSLVPHRSECLVGIDMYRYLMVFEVIAFSCFLFSSLVAHGFKLFIVLGSGKLQGSSKSAEINNKFLRFGILASALGSMFGTIFLMLSMIALIQVRLGSLSCGNSWSVVAAVPLISMGIPGATYIYLLSAVFFLPLVCIVT